MEQPEFLTPVAQAQRAGLTPYWLGEGLEGGNVLYRIDGFTELIGQETNELSLTFQYGGGSGERGGIFRLQTFSKDGSGPQEVRQTALNLPGATSRDVRVGAWEGEVLLLPSLTRPVNTVLLFVEVNDVIVIATVKSGSSGILGDDVNPLLDPDLLVEVIAEHLRPYPE